ncbi:ABC transporter B family member 25 [Hondaea fermentalgiana]|uniref:ABC transporter B family member 25 n=1 Tax=Hondaea fermentalgiana TaxID=2315210 RepID=A0A2R5G9G1_9STRA|nr:ABC transporter B family member 25 [Hondaea fermentalgiana]|eukprot:GBG27185.1 ABC transporter B family member 25 [Hondaea fermentalgiana]
MGGRLTLRAKADAATRVREAAGAAAQDADDPAAALRQPLAAAVAWAGSRAREVNLVVETVARLGLEAHGAAADAVHEPDDLGLLVDVLRYRVPVIVRPEVLELWRPVLEILERTALENGDERQALLEAALWMLLLHDPGSSQGSPSAISAQSAVLTVGGSALFGCDFMQSFESLLKESANSNDKNEREIFLEAAEAELARRAAATRTAQEEHQALLDSCDWIGFDLDNTLVTYESIAARAIRYQAVVRHLKESLTSGVSETSGPDQYLSKVAESIPHELEPKHSWMCEKKCLVLDADEGLILEVDADKWVVFAFLGSALLARSEMDRLGYAEAPIDTSLQRYLILHTEIEQPFAAVLAACLDAEKKRDLVELRREWLERVRQAFIFVQSKFCPFSFEASLDQDASALVVKRTALVLPWLRRLVKRGGTKLFVLTNADWEHSQRTMDAAFPGQNWRSLFDFIVTSAHKSQFFATSSSCGVPKPVVNESGVFVGGNGTRRVVLLGIVLALDLCLCICFDQVTKRHVTKFVGILDGVLLFSIGRTFVNLLALAVCVRWAYANRHIQAQGLEAAYADMSAAEVRRPLLADPRQPLGLRRNVSIIELEHSEALRNPEILAYKVRRRAEFSRNLVLGIAFVFDTFIAFYMAIRCITVEFAWSKVQVPLLFGIMMVASVEFFVLKGAVDVVGRDRGHLLEALHPHKLYFWPRLPFNTCDICMGRVRGRGYRCKRCDFDVCRRCFSAAVHPHKHGTDGNTPQTSSSPAPAKGISFWSTSIREMVVQHALLLSVAIICVFGNAAAKVGLPNFQGQIIDAVFEKDLKGFHNHIHMLIACGLLVVFLGIVRDTCVSIIGRKVATSVRNDMFQKLIQQEHPFYDQNMSGGLTASLTNDVNAMVSPWRAVIVSLFTNMLVMIGGLGVCLFTSWRLTAVAVTSLVPITYLLSVYSRWSTRLNREIWGGIADANGIATEAFNNISTVKAHAMESAEVARFIEATGNALAKGIKDAFGTALANVITQNLSMTGTFLILGFGGYEALMYAEHLTPGELVKFMLYWNVINNAYQEINSNMDAFNRAAGAAQRVFGLLSTLESNLLEAARVRRETLYEEVALDADVGCSDPQLFASSILANITYGLAPGEYTESDVITAAQDAHAHGFIMELDRGYQTRVGERGLGLSGGERARIVLARALLRKPRLLILDEPTAQLDPNSRRLVERTIAKKLEAKRTTVLMITHDRMEPLQLVADTVILLDRGGVAEMGTHAALSADPTSQYHRLFGG